MLDFGTEANIEKLAKTSFENDDICRLEQKTLRKDQLIIKPKKNFIREKHGLFDFNFKDHTSEIKKAYDNGNCYQLKCDEGKGEQKLNLPYSKTEYCFGTMSRDDDIVNPFAEAKYEDGEW